MNPHPSDPPHGGEEPEGAGQSLPAHFREKSPLTDTAGVPWQGRGHAPSPFPGDDGSVPAALAEARAAGDRGEDPYRRTLVAALARSRLLVPIMAVTTEEGTTAHGLTGDHGADMAMVSMTAPDGQRILPVFSSVPALGAWRSDARPVPVAAPQAAQAAVQEGCTALLLDPVGHSTPSSAGTEGTLLPRSVLWALAQGREWIPPFEDPDLARELDRIAADTGHVLALSARPGTGAEVDLQVRLADGLDATGVRSVVEDLSGRLGASMLVADRISSLRLSLSR